MEHDITEVHSDVTHFATGPCNSTGFNPNKAPTHCV